LKLLKASPFYKKKGSIKHESRSGKVSDPMKLSCDCTNERCDRNLFHFNESELGPQSDSAHELHEPHRVPSRVKCERNVSKTI